MRTEWDSIKIWDFHSLARPKRKWRLTWSSKERKEVRKRARLLDLSKEKVTWLLTY